MGEDSDRYFENKIKVKNKIIDKQADKIRELMMNNEQVFNLMETKEELLNAIRDVRAMLRGNAHPDAVFKVLTDMIKKHDAREERTLGKVVRKYASTDQGNARKDVRTIVG